MRYINLRLTYLLLTRLHHDRHYRPGRLYFRIHVCVAWAYLLHF